MNYTSVRRSFILLILVVGSASWVYASVAFSRHKGEILIQLAEIAEDLSLPYRIAKLEALPPDSVLLLPLRNVSLSEIVDTFGALRSEGRTHDGIDIFAARGTPVFAAASGYVVRMGENTRGGNFVLTMGAGGRRYYYAHLDAIALGIERGEEVTTDTLLGYVGNTGNASGTPTHLHFGMYGQGGAQNPYPLLVSRPFF